MPTYREIYIIRDRTRYSASYFVEAGKLSMGSAFGSMTAPLGRRKPEVVAEKLLTSIIDAWSSAERTRLTSSKPKG
jgi:hypothetical protein